MCAPGNQKTDRDGEISKGEPQPAPKINSTTTTTALSRVSDEEGLNGPTTETPLYNKKCHRNRS